MKASEHFFQWNSNGWKDSPCYQKQKVTISWAIDVSMCEGICLLQVNEDWKFYVLSCWNYVMTTEGQSFLLWCHWWTLAMAKNALLAMSKECMWDGGDKWWTMES